MAITNKIRPIPAFGEVSVSNWQEAGLIKPSAIKPIFATIEKTLVLKQLGLLVEEDKKAVRDTLQTIIG
jgi:mRNA interferase MazF